MNAPRSFPAREPAPSPTDAEVMMGRHHREWRPPPDHPELAAALRKWAATSVTPPTCPRCGAQRPIDYGSRVGCGECGNLWQAGPDEPPLGPRERYEARRRLDATTDAAPSGPDR